MLLVWLAACGGAPDTGGATVDDAACDSAPEVTWDGWTDGFFLTYCRACHSATTPDRRGAPVGTDFDTEAQVRAQADAIRRAVLEDATMPVGGGVYEDDQALLGVFLDCGG